jgi:NAD(P)-dependent dehydrogenase (short-subunit alcohol dehydrogenase family)
MAEQQLLAGRAALVTGAASGMGRVMTRALAAAGARVAGVDVDAARLAQLAAEPGFGGTFLAVPGDVSQAAACRDAVKKVVDGCGALDILVNCAGISMSYAAGHREPRVKFFDADPDGWQRIVAINCVGAFLMARFAAEPMIKRAWGRIINVTTSFDTMLAAGLSAYGASKAALEACCVSFAKDLEGTGVTVNILVPGGPTDTPGFFPPGKPRPPVLLDPEIMAAPIVWLASPQSDGISACRFIARDCAPARTGRLADLGAGRHRRPRPRDVANRPTGLRDRRATRRRGESSAACCWCGCDPWRAPHRDRRGCRW